MARLPRNASKAPVEKEGGLYRGATVTGADIDIEARPPLRRGIANRIGPLVLLGLDIALARLSRRAPSFDTDKLSILRNQLQE